jgi:hypothetical protein
MVWSLKLVMDSIWGHVLTVVYSSLYADMIIEASAKDVRSACLND